MRGLAGWGVLFYLYRMCLWGKYLWACIFLFSGVLVLTEAPHCCLGEQSIAHRSLGCVACYSWILCNRSRNTMLMCALHLWNRDGLWFVRQELFRRSGRLESWWAVGEGTLFGGTCLYCLVFVWCVRVFLLLFVKKFDLWVKGLQIMVVWGKRKERMECPYFFTVNHNKCMRFKTVVSWYRVWCVSRKRSILSLCHLLMLVRSHA